MDDLHPFDLYDREAERLDHFFGGLDEQAWQRSSRCDGWSVRDVLGHLAGEEAYNHACLDGTVGEFVKGITGLDEFNEQSVRDRRDRPVHEVLGEWREANSQTRRRMRERGEDGTLETAGGPYPVGLQTMHYASELATHGDDVGAPPGETGWRARFARQVLAEKDSGVEVADADNGGYVIRTRNGLARLSEPDFVNATVGRLPSGPPELRCLA